MVRSEPLPLPVMPRSCDPAGVPAAVVGASELDLVPPPADRRPTLRLRRELLLSARDELEIRRDARRLPLPPAGYGPVTPSSSEERDMQQPYEKGTKSNELDMDFGS